jgi:hypothetical protein
MVVTTCSRMSANKVGRPLIRASTLSAGNPTSLPRGSCALVGHLTARRPTV